MASQVCETLGLINGDDGVRGMEVWEMNGALLMSLMEEPSQSEESDDDRLDSLIRSFEAEISGGKMGDDEFANASMMEEDEYWVDMDLVPFDCGDDYSSMGEHGYNSLWQHMPCN
ncbi:hypothetical protein RJT34_29371 [Clitoria ternatea]|uniref:Uncharacterized protein n=1 Tax=Clitoria ternatea TaxID=43366 RepID=A0AAN9FC14_CLITE